MRHGARRRQALGDLTERERTIIEPEAQLHRQRLTAIERSRAIMRLVAASAAQLRASETPQAGPGVQATADGVPTTGRIYQEKPDSQAKVAAELGVSQSHISDVRRHVAAVERYPELGASGVSQRAALRLAMTWDRLSRAPGARARRAWNAKRQAKPARASGAAKQPRAQAIQPAEVSAEVRLKRAWYYFAAGLMQMINDFEHSGSTAALLALWTPEECAHAQDQITERVTQLTRLQAELDAGAPQGLQAGG